MLWKRSGARTPALLAGVVLAVLCGQLAYGIVSDGLTVDELVYIGAGYRHLSAGDFRLNPEQPAVAKLLGALPLLRMEQRAPEANAGDDQWGWSHRFVHGSADPTRVIRAVRVPIALLTLALAVLVWQWGRRVHGEAGGVAALVLVAFHPSLIAHGHLLTTDLAGTLALCAASLALWYWALRPSLRRGAWVGLAFGIAIATRLTGWLFLPAALALLVLRRRSAGARSTLAEEARLLAIAAAVAFAVVWSVYGLRYQPWPGETIAKVPGPWLGFAGTVIASLERLRLLPEAYLEGARALIEHAVIGHPTYLLGRMSNAGWRDYYLVALAVKNTPGFLLAIVAAVWAIWLKRGSVARGGIEAHWLLPALALFAAASFGRTQIGERYILPVYPFLALLAASVVPALLASRFGRVALCVAAALHAVPCLAAARHGYLTYFNALAGGRLGAHRVLLDSNLDWGQDLPRLAAWMAHNDVETVQLGYHGTDDPARVGIEVESLPGLHTYAARPAARPFEGVVAVSPNLLMGVFDRPGEVPYERLRERTPIARAGALFIYELP